MVASYISYLHGLSQQHYTLNDFGTLGKLACMQTYTMVYMVASDIVAIFRHSYKINFPCIANYTVSLYSILWLVTKKASGSYHYIGQ